jgi:hypothetical protein
VRDGSALSSFSQRDMVSHFPFSQTPENAGAFIEGGRLRLHADSKSRDHLGEYVFVQLPIVRERPEITSVNVAIRRGARHHLAPDWAIQATTIMGLQANCEWE